MFEGWSPPMSPLSGSGPLMPGRAWRCVVVQGGWTSGAKGVLWHHEPPHVGQDAGKLSLPGVLTKVLTGAHTRDMNSHDFTITSHTCRVCGTEVLCDEDTGARMHRDVTYDKACRELRNGRT